MKFQWSTKGQIINILALIQILTWGRPGDKPLSEIMVYRRIYALLDPNDLSLIQTQW